MKLCTIFCSALLITGTLAGDPADSFEGMHGNRVDIGRHEYLQQGIMFVIW